MIEDKATEKWKKRLTDMGLIVNAGNKPTDTTKRATSQKNASNGPSSKKRGGKR